MLVQWFWNQSYIILDWWPGPGIMNMLILFVVILITPADRLSDMNTTTNKFNQLETWFIKFNSVKCKVVLTWGNKNKVMKACLETSEEENKTKQPPQSCNCWSPTLWLQGRPKWSPPWITNLGKLFVTCKVPLIPVTLEGVQSKTPQNESLRHADYFELKAIETLKAQEKFCLSLNYLPRRIWLWGPSQNKSYYYWWLLSEWPILIAGQTSDYRMPAPLTALWTTLRPLDAPGPTLSLGSGWYDLILLFSCNLSCVWDSNTYKIKFDFFLLTCLMSISF